MLASTAVRSKYEEERVAEEEDDAAGKAVEVRRMAYQACWQVGCLENSGQEGHWVQITGKLAFSWSIRQCKELTRQGRHDQLSSGID